MTALRAPYPYIGGKARIAPVVWSLLGNPRLYIEPFFGSGAVLLGRPHAPGLETVNDVDGHVANAWRSMQWHPQETAKHADWPVNELDLHARHRELVHAARAHKLALRLEADPRYCNPELAGWWIWGASQWIGGGWCADRANVHHKRPMVAGTNPGRGAHRNTTVWRQRPHLTTANGVHADVTRQLPDAYGLGGKGVHGHRVQGDGIRAWFETLSARLRRVRVVCGDFARVLTHSTLHTEGTHITAVYLDPPYAHDQRDGGLYAHDDGTASARARVWALEHGDDPKFRIVLSGLEGEHAMPSTWRTIAWKGAPGLGTRPTNDNRHRERLWASPHCVAGSGDMPLFGGAQTSSHAPDEDDTP